MYYQPISKDQVLQAREINEVARFRILADLNYINRMAVEGKLWTLSSAKISKTDDEHTKNIALFLAPADEIASPQFTMCPWAVINNCKPTCIAFQGRLGMPSGQRAQMWKTVLLLLNEEYFNHKLVDELTVLEIKYGDDLLVRPDGTSDRLWGWLAALFPNLRFYGYSKGISKIQKNKSPNLKLTFSGSNANPTVLARTVKAIKLGLKTAIALNTAGTKGEWSLPNDNSRLVDFDKNDNRFDDPDGALGFLKRKGSNKTSRMAEENAPSSFFFTEDALNHLLEVTNH